MHVSFYIQKGWQFYSDELVEYSKAIEYLLYNSSLFSGSNNDFNTVKAVWCKGNSLNNLIDMYKFKFLK